MSDTVRMLSLRIEYSDGKALTMEPAELVPDGWQVRLGSEVFGINTCIVAASDDHAARMAMDQADQWRKEKSI